MSKSQKRIWIIESVLSAVAVLFAVMIRGFADFHAVSFICGILFSVTLLGILGWTAFRLLHRAIAVSPFALMLWIIFGDGLFYDELAINFDSRIPLVICVAIVAIWAGMMAARWIVCRRNGVSYRWKESMRALFGGFVLFSATVLMSLSLLGTAFHPAPPSEVEITLGEYEGYASHTTGTKHQYRVIYEGEEALGFDSIAIRDTYRTEEGDRVRLTCDQGYFGVYYKICYDGLEPNEDWTPIVKKD